MNYKGWKLTAQAKVAGSSDKGISLRYAIRNADRHVLTGGRIQWMKFLCHIRGEVNQCEIRLEITAESLKAALKSAKQVIDALEAAGIVKSEKAEDLT